jgi:hypothetical protein
MKFYEKIIIDKEKLDTRKICIYNNIVLCLKGGKMKYGKKDQKEPGSGFGTGRCGYAFRWMQFGENE